MTKKDDDVKTKSAGSLLGRNKLAVAVIAAATLVFVTISFGGDRAALFCSPSSSALKIDAAVAAEYETTPSQLLAILHYATTKEIPQQSNAEVRVTFEVLKSASPSNFLVYGVGRDSLMWHSLNPRGNTMFLEEDPEWLRAVKSRSPILDARAVKYPMRLSEVDDLIKSY